MATTVLNDLVNPEVLAPMISGKLTSMIKVTPFAKIDATLQGQAGNTITVPYYGYIGDAADVAEGAACPTTEMATSTKQYTVKKIMKAVELTDEAVLSGYGNPQGEAATQLAKAIASKVDNDSMDALYEATSVFDGSAAKIAYTGIVDALDVFGEEENNRKVMFINPAQVGSIRKDSNFIANHVIGANLMVSGSIGMIANTEIVVSKKAVKHDTWYKFDSQGTVIGSGEGQIALANVLPTLPTAKAGDKVTLVETPCYFNPIVRLEDDSVDTNDETPAITIFMKKDLGLETERNTLKRLTDISVDKHYVAALTNGAKVVLGKFKA